MGSVSNASDDGQYIKSFLNSIVSNMVIGQNDTLIEMAIIDSDVHKLWNLTTYQTQSDLIAAIGNIDFGNSISRLQLDFGDIRTFVRREALKHRRGDRTDVQNELVLILDNQSRVTSSWYTSTLWSSHNLSVLNGNVIVISVGPMDDDDAAAEIESLATDPSHILHVGSYSELETITDALLNLICS